jgi:hypothetical protein
MDSTTKCNTGFEFDSSQNGFEHFVVLNSLPKGKLFGFRNPRNTNGGGLSRAKYGKPRTLRLLCGGYPFGTTPELSGNASMMIVETQHAASLP